MVFNYLPPREKERFGIDGVLGEDGVETGLDGGDGGVEGEAGAYYVERDCWRHFHVWNVCIYFQYSQKLEEDVEAVTPQPLE
jgi:hypothetical protein